MVGNGRLRSDCAYQYTYLDALVRHEHSPFLPGYVDSLGVLCTYACWFQCVKQVTVSLMSRSHTQVPLSRVGPQNGPRLDVLHVGWQSFDPSVQYLPRFIWLGSHCMQWPTLSILHVLLNSCAQACLTMHVGRFRLGRRSLGIGLGCYWGALLTACSLGIPNELRPSS